MSVAIIIVHYHTPQLLIRAVNCLLADIKRSKMDADIIVVDNGSTPKDQQLFNTLPILYIKNSENLGYARALNLGASHADADTLIFMNADVMVSPGCLATLKQSLNDKVGAVGPRLYLDSNHTILLPPTEMYTPYDEILRRLATSSRWIAKLAYRRWRAHVHRHWTASDPVRSLSLSGALLAVRRDVWEQVGAFDEAYQLYFEENDWLQRLTKAGFIAQYIGSATAWHIYNQSDATDATAGKWFSKSEVRFKQCFYGKRIWSLIKKIPLNNPPSVKSTIVLNENKLSIPLSSQALYPIWIEIVASPLGFPGVGVYLENDTSSNWTMHPDVWDTLAHGTYYINVVDSRSRVVARFKMVKSLQQSTAKVKQ